ncbi:MAG: hypothetical protein K2Y20_11345 [Sphingomonas sp.]|uniref:hypothetical protein n=1 Tax=Sphingomonas sp. TaxID=28214 RepID=UPI0025D3B5F8|nr:hypothetical protein [Sphingomonas sp.]MBX9860171.1 hypothetical protein [Sphingomonas sp.]MBY0283813.1 hypothetical protein [Sphingomonas sp.]
MFLRTRFAGSLGAAIAAGLLVAAFGPATAAPQPGRTTQTDKVVGNNTTAATPDRKIDTRRYCMRYTPTGSRIERQHCQTRAEWGAEGVDVDNPDQ